MFGCIYLPVEAVADALDEAVAVAVAPEEQALPPYAAAIACAAACPAAELMACAAAWALQTLLEETLWDLACKVTRPGDSHLTTWSAPAHLLGNPKERDDFTHSMSG